MKIIVSDVQRLGNSLRITFGHNLDTPEGRRALRILYMQIHSGHHFDQRSITLYHASAIGAINTRANCQAEMDRLANAPLSVSFGEPIVYAAEERGNLLASLEAVRKARAAGFTVAIAMRCVLSLPMISHDRTILQTIVPGGVYHDDNDPNVINLVIYMRDRLADKDPWTYVAALRSTIQQAIT